MFEASINEFPFVAELPKREKSKLATVWDRFKALSAVSKEAGCLVPPVFVASVLGISKQRVYQLGETGKLEVIRLEGQVFVTERSIIALARSERKSGRPFRTPETNREMWDASVKASKEMFHPTDK